jgi:crossover junction endodeoxyribonuclease RuvC
MQDAGPIGLLLGVDPGLANTGWALLDGESRVVECGTIRTAPGPPGPRLLRIVTELKEVLAVHAVAEAALEELFVGRNATSAVVVAQARGAVLTMLAEAGIPVQEYKPAQVKAVLTGYGKANKEQVLRVIGVQTSGGAEMDDHAADAAAIAVCHARSRRFRQLTGTSSSGVAGRVRGAR